MEDKDTKGDPEEQAVDIAPFLVVSRHPDGEVRVEGPLSAYEAPTVLRLAALSIERKLGIRE